jgi:hypothetical protein
MSLIHDSLSKLETKKVKSFATSFNKQNDTYENKKSSLKKLWIGISIIIALAIVSYALVLITNYQKQNETLLNDIQKFSNNNSVSENQNINNDKPNDVFVVQTPAVIKATDLELENSTKSLELAKLNNSLIAKSNLVGTQATKQFKTLSNISASDENTIADKFNTIKTELKEDQPIVTKKNNTPKPTAKKMTVKQTRTLVNELQLQMELKNSEEVNLLLQKLAASSGKDSLVYLRMHAYWSNINDDPTSAILLYKKILVQKPFDKQAGTNLALIEANNNQKQQALKRLELLKNKYPTDKNIVDYYNKIEVQ